MKKNNKKLFLYELKNTFLIPTVFAAFCVVCALVVTVFLGKTKNDINAYDVFAKGSLYIFYAIVLLVFTYRTFVTRKIYEKMRVNPNKLFWIRILYIFGYCFIFTCVLLLLGTLDLQSYKNAGYEKYRQIAQTLVFAYQEKTGWYFLFGAAVGMTGAITYSVVVFIQNMIFSQDRWYLKIVWAIAFVFVFAAVGVCQVFTTSLSALGSTEYFSVPLPFGALTYNEYLSYYSAARHDPYIFTEYNFQIVRFDLCWNIANGWMLLGGLSIIVFAFLSIGFLYRGRNADYEYAAPKEEEK